MIRIAVVEDEKKEQENMLCYLQKYESQHEISFEITVYEDGSDFIENYTNQYDLIFCDIQMKFLGGIETAKRLRQMNENVLLIFITNLSEFAIQGYEVSALDYILKPLSYAILERCLDKSLERLKNAEINYLTITEGNRLQRFDVNEILYIECCNHTQTIYTSTGQVRTFTSLSVMESALDPKKFMKCNSGCLVHLSKVQELKGNYVCIDGKELKISRYRKKEFVDALSESMFQEF